MCSPRISSVARKPRSLSRATTCTASSVVSPAMYLFATRRTMLFGTMGNVPEMTRSSNVIKRILSKIMKRLLVLAALLVVYASQAVSDVSEKTDSEFVFARVQFNMDARWIFETREAPWHHDYP